MRQVFRDKKYLEFVKTKHCVVHRNCGSIVEPHHWRTKGAQMNDLYAVPLCAEHHREFHNYGRLTFLKNNNLDEVYVFDCMIQMAAEYVREKK